MQAYNYISNLTGAILGKKHLSNVYDGFKSYSTDLLDAIQGKEHFVGTSNAGSGLEIGGLLLYILLIIVFGVAYSYGAARLSYCYNIYLGESSGTASLWAVFAFIFAGYYYPIHGIFLTPCGVSKHTQFGGRRYK